MKERIRVNEEAHKALMTLANYCVREYQKNKEKMEVAEKSDWKILDVECLPGDILVGDYEFEFSSKRNNSDLQSNVEYDGWCPAKNVLEAIKELLNNNLDVRYRLKPKKKTHEELAIEWYRETYPNSKYSQNSLKAFIAGRKSMELECEG